MEIAVASGKGGTGKTLVASSLAYLASKRTSVIAVDADVEAPDLLLALGGPKGEVRREEFYGAWLPVIDLARCRRCGRCVEVCRFDAITMTEAGPVVDPEKCEGLGVCAMACPAGAITLKPKLTGYIVKAVAACGIPVITGELLIGGSNSGRLVYELKRRAAMEPSSGRGLVVIDCAPGIGCPVVSSICGADLLVVVTEPLPAAIQGARRLLELAKCLDVPTAIIVNKADLNPDLAAKIPRILEARYLGSIPYDDAIPKAYAEMLPVPELRASPAAEAIRDLILGLLDEVLGDA